MELLARRAGSKLDQEELQLLALAKDGMIRLNTLLEGSHRLRASRIVVDRFTSEHTVEYCAQRRTRKSARRDH